MPPYHPKAMRCLPTLGRRDSSPTVLSNGKNSAEASRRNMTGEGVLGIFAHTPLSAKYTRCQRNILILCELPIGVHQVPHADPVGVEQISGADNDFAAQSIHVRWFDELLPEQQVISGAGDERHEGDGQKMGGMVIQGPQHDVMAAGESRDRLPPKR